MTVTQPTRGTSILASCYGQSKVPIMQPTRGTPDGIRRCGRSPFSRSGPLVFAPRSRHDSMTTALANDTTFMSADANDARFRTITRDADHPSALNRTPWASGRSFTAPSTSGDGRRNHKLVDVTGRYRQPSIWGLPPLQVFASLHPRQGKDSRNEESNPCECGGDQGAPRIARPPVDQSSIRHAGSYDDECAEDQ